MMRLSSLSSTRRMLLGMVGAVSSPRSLGVTLTEAPHLLNYNFTGAARYLRNPHAARSRNHWRYPGVAGNFRSMRRARRAFWFRPLATLLAVWLPLFVGEPNLVSPCPTHGALAVARGNAHGTAGSMHRHGHASMASSDASRHGSQSPGHDEKDCACIGCCTPGVARAAVVGAPIAIVTVATYEPELAFPPADTHPQLAPELSRPYPTGPPRA